MTSIEFNVTGEALWKRMERAVERVNERLRRTVGILEKSGVPYAVVGGHAVRAWVAQVDEAAVRAILARGVGEVIAPEWYGVVGQAITSRPSRATTGS